MCFGNFSNHDFKFLAIISIKIMNQQLIELL